MLRSAPPTSREVIQIGPFWKIVEREAAVGAASSGGAMDDAAPRAALGPLPIFLHPSEAWGTGSHPTTQLCLQAIGWLSGRAPSSDQPPRELWRALDFGAGSGLLAIACALWGARVDAVEIDPRGVSGGEFNVEQNGLSSRVRYSRELPPRKAYDLVVANILRPVLLEFADELSARLHDDGCLILSGLLATDLPEVSVRYGARLAGRTPKVFARGEWRALVWSP